MDGWTDVDGCNVASLANLTTPYGVAITTPYSIKDIKHADPLSPFLKKLSSSFLPFF